MRSGRRSTAIGLLALLAFSAVAHASHDTPAVACPDKSPVASPTPCKSPSPFPKPCASPSPSPVCKPSPKPVPVCASPPPPKCDPKSPPPKCPSPPPPKCPSPPPPKCPSPPPPKCPSPPPPKCPSPPPPKCDPSPPPPVCKPAPSPVCKPSPSPSPCKSPSPSPKPCASPSPSPKPCASPSPSPTPCKSPSPSPTPCKSPSPSPTPCKSPSPTPTPCDKPVHPPPKPVPEPPKCLTAYELLVRTPSLAALKAAVDNTGLAAALSDPAFVGTIFAPTNHAVGTCFTTGCLTQSTILYHAIIGGSYSALGLFKFGNPVSYFMGNGGIATMRLNQTDKSVTVLTQRNQASVIVPNVAFCGGYVHIIDTVLDPRPLMILPPGPPLPPATCRPTAYDMISSFPQLAGFKALLDRTGRAAVLQRDFTGTIFAPIVTWVGLPGTNETLTVDNHLIRDTVLTYPTQLAGQVLTAASGLKLTVVSQTNLIYNQTSPVPVNLRLTTPDGAYADFLNPGFVNMQACGYIIHFVSIPLWSPVQTIG